MLSPRLTSTCLAALTLATLQLPAMPLGLVCTVTSTLGCFIDGLPPARVLPNGFKAPALPATRETCASLVAGQIGSAAMSTTLLGVEASPNSRVPVPVPPPLLSPSHMFNSGT